MTNDKLIETLKDLKQNRRLSSESEIILEPFVGMTTEFTFSFLEASSIFSSRFDDKYIKGKTMIALIVEYDLECSILFPSSEIDWVEGLRKEDQFDLKVVVLELDNLYQRVVFGKVLEEKIEQDEISNEDIIEKNQVLEKSGKNEIVKDQEGLLDIDSGNSVEGKVPFLKIDDSTTAANEVCLKEEKENEEELVLEDMQEFENQIAEKFNEVEKLESESTLNEMYIPEQTVNSCKELHRLSFSDWKKVLIRKDFSNEFLSNGELEYKYFEYVNSLEGLKKPNISENKEFEGKSVPPPIPSLETQRKAHGQDNKELQRIRDKVYDEGMNSLTFEEKEILGLSKTKKKKYQKDIEKHDNSKMIAWTIGSILLFFVGLYAQGGVVLMVIAVWILIHTFKKMKNRI